MSLHREVERLARAGLDLGRGVMSRWLEDLGGTLGATVVESMRKDSIANAFCLATDATGISIQPPREAEKGARRACRKGHIFTVVADRKHVFYYYTPRETSAAVAQIFRGFSGYVQADAKSVFDVLYVPPEKRTSRDARDGEPPDEGVREEVGCWAHARRKFWEAATAGIAVAREALFRIHRIYEIDAALRGKPPSAITAGRRQRMAPEMRAFFTWAEVEAERLGDARGMLRSAFGYALRQREALMRPLEDGRLPLDNNRSELALRRVAIGRKNWLFAGSDDHAESAANLMTLIASARLHDHDPERYLAELIRVLPHWPAARYLELSPACWATTRARLDPAALAQELGPLAVPERPTEEEAHR